MSAKSKKAATLRKALAPNALRAIRHVDGFHKRVVESKIAYRRREKHRGRSLDY